MNDELVKTLRYCGSEDGCKGCPRENDKGKCYDDICIEAADAVEELTGFVQEAERDRDEYRERLDKANDAIEDLEKQLDEETEYATALTCNMPQWIPVTERLPEEPYGCLAIVWDNPRYGGGDMFLNYYPEYIGFDGERWNDYDGQEIPLEVVYWMKMPKIPEPPKEE